MMTIHSFICSPVGALERQEDEKMKELLIIQKCFEYLLYYCISVQKNLHAKNTLLSGIYSGTYLLVYFLYWVLYL